LVDRAPGELGQERIALRPLVDDRGLLAGHDQRLLYIPDRAVNRAASSYRGEGRTDARDGAIIADQPGCAGICTRCAPATKSPPSRSCSPVAASTVAARASQADIVFSRDGEVEADPRFADVWPR
jgi:hypothetical protein